MITIIITITQYFSSKANDNDNGNDNNYYVVTNKWTKFTDYPMTVDNLYALSKVFNEDGEIYNK